VQGGGPFQLTETFVNEFRNNQPQFAFPNPYPSGSGNVPSQSVFGFPLGTRNGMIHQFNATVEHQWKDIGFRLSYVGSRSRGLNYNIQINKPQPSLTPFTAARRPYPQFVNASLARSNGRSTYNALAVEAQRKFGRGLTFQGHWTWSSNLHDWLNLQNPYAPLFWNRDNFIARHRVSLNTAYELPFGKGRSYLASAPGAVNSIVGGWTLYYLLLPDRLVLQPFVLRRRSLEHQLVRRHSGPDRKRQPTTGPTNHRPVVRHQRLCHASAGPLRQFGA